ncbi:MAG: FAD:protein FMN transferase [Bacteroidia bacterium]|nr:FAD:protein FMN transferase [Bacteroidia bacterium]
MKGNLRHIILLLLILAGHSARPQMESPSPKAHTKSLILMGSAFGFTVVHEDDSLAWAAINAGIAEVERITKVISSWDPTSQTSEINRQAGISFVQVDQELYDLIFRAKKVSELTDGAFDISFAAADRIWKFDGSMTEIPDSARVAASVRKIDWHKVVLRQENGFDVFLQEEGMKIGFGAIGKGYAANRARKVMEAMGVKNGLVNAGGDLICWGQQADGKPWQIGIADPKDRSRVEAWLDVSGLAVVTSGDYERFAMLNGRRYAHIIDPRTGWPASGLQSVTVICKDAEVADALATAVFVMGKSKGLALVNQLMGVEAILVDEKGEFFTSELIKLNYYSQTQPGGKPEWQAEIGVKK